jgi:superfamily II DNA helicase RecQ
LSTSSEDADIFRDDNLESSEESDDSDGVDEFDDTGMDITRQLAKKNYRTAGSEVPEPPPSVRVEDYADIMDPDVVNVLNEVVEKIGLPYVPAPFQRVAAVALGSRRHVVMVMGTGSGKMTVPLLSSLILRRTMSKPRGVTIITQPLTGLMLEQLKNPVCKVAVLSMDGNLTVGAEEERGKLNCSLDALLDGEFPVLVGHPESFSSPMGQHILRELQSRDRIIQIVIDEVHTNLHWSDFRPGLMQESCSLRTFAVKGAPVCLMTATATEKELKTVSRCLGLQRTPPVLIASNPVQEHIKISVVRRPANAFGLRGKDGKNGARKPGLWDHLNNLYFHDMLQDRAAGRKPKKAIIFFRGMKPMSALYTHLRAAMGLGTVADAEVAMVHGVLTPPTEQVIIDRMDEYTVILATTRMLLGLDISQVDLVIFVQPYDEVAGLLQGGGRGGRRKASGVRTRVQVYQCWNSEDLSRRNKHMSEDMRHLCRTGTAACTRQFLRARYHIGPVVPAALEEEEQAVWCCHHHDQLAEISSQQSH